MMAIGDKMVVVFLLVMLFQSSSSTFIQMSSSIHEVKLIGGSIPSEGNVYTVNSDNILGPVCDDTWEDRDARVVCRQLGYADGTAIIGSWFGMVPNFFLMDDVNCTGREARLQDCSYNIRNDCGPSEGAGVNCTNPIIVPVSVKLIGGSIPSEGNVYAVNSDNKLGPVCDDAWDDRDARVVCRQLGYTDGIATTGSKFGNVPNNFSMDDVNCNGGEARIQDCVYNIRDDCSASEGAGVNCTNSIPIVPAIDGGWTVFSDWSPCSATCQMGSKSRSRTCTNPVPQFGGNNCQGRNLQVQSCVENPHCPIPGGWSNFSPFSQCSVTCGTGIKEKTRTCTNPPPQYGGSHCKGVSKERERCVLVENCLPVKLIGGSIPSEGNVYAVNSNNKLGPVCDDAWDDRDARVVCRQLGYADGIATTGSKFGNVPNNFSMDDVKCNGSEARIQDCSYIIQHNCGSSEGAGVNCTNPIVPGTYFQRDEMVLVQNNLITMIPTLGKEYTVSVQFNATSFRSSYQNIIYLSTISGTDPGAQKANPALWINSSKKIYKAALIDGRHDHSEIGDIISTDEWITVEMSQKLKNGKYMFTILVDGKQEFEKENTKPEEYKNVKVYAANPWQEALPGSIKNFYLQQNLLVSVKLIGGSIPSEGNVHAINSDNKLGPVCDDAWEDRDARVVCRQLGYADGIATSGSKFGNVPNNFAMDDVNCTGGEARIQDCSYNIQHNCGTREGAGVKCINLNDSVCGRSGTIIRRSVYDLSSENVTAYNNALKTIKSYSYENPKSFPNIGSYHGAPWMCNWNQSGPPTRDIIKNTDTGCCVNHWYQPTSILLFNPWHRLYTYQMEQSLYEASGLSMPYWDWTTPNPYYGIYQPNKLPYLAKQKEWLNGPIKGSYNHLSGVQNLTTRGPKANINYRRLKGMVRTAYNQHTFHDFNYQIVHPHNLIHLHVGSCPADYWEANYKNQAENCNIYSFGNGSGEYIPIQAGHMASNYWASYDPIFYLHHSFVDYQYAFYQELHKLDPSTYKMNYKKEDVKMQPYDRSTNPYPASKQYSTGKQGERYKDVFCYEYDHLLFDGLTPQQFIENEKERRKFFRIYAGISLKRTEITSNIAFEMLHNDSSKYVGSLATLGVPNKKPNYSQSLLNKRVVLYDVTDELQDPLGAQTANVKFNVTRYTDGETENMDLPLQETYKPIVIYQEPNSDDQIFQLHVEDAHEYAPIMYGKLGHKVEFLKNGLSLRGDNDVTAYVGGHFEDIEKPINGRYPIEYQEHTFVVNNDAGQINITIGYDLDDIECEDGHPYHSDPDTKVIPWNIDWLTENRIFNVPNCPSTSVIIASCTDSLSTVKKTTQQDYEHCTNLWSKGNDGIMGLLVDTKNTGTIYYASGKKISNTENFCDIGGKIAINVLEC